MNNKVKILSYLDPEVQKVLDEKRIAINMSHYLFLNLGNDEYALNVSSHVTKHGSERYGTSFRIIYIPHNNGVLMAINSMYEDVVKDALNHQ